MRGSDEPYCLHCGYVAYGDKVPAPDGGANQDYKDTGCEHNTSCLGCPFPACKEDGGKAPSKHWKRDQAFVRLWLRGVNPIVIAKTYSVHRRTVDRAIKANYAKGEAA